MDALTEFFEDEVDLEVGDVVRLLSGGPNMTIMDISNDIYTCIWFCADKRLQSARFVPATVEYIV